MGALASASTLKREVVEGTDLLVVRELTGGIYFGQPKGVTKLADGTERGVNTEVYTTPEIERIAHVAFQAALKRRKKVTSVDKANVLEVTELWRKVVTRIHHKDEGYAGVQLEHMLVDNCAMQLIRNPKQFDVVVTTNMFGDIVSDLAAQMVGGLGFGCSGNIGEKLAVFEPSHGSAPKYAGMYKVNPIATILSAKMMLDWLGETEKAAALEKATAEVIRAGKVRTYDMGGKSTTLEMGRAIAEKL